VQQKLYRAEGVQSFASRAVGVQSFGQMLVELRHKPRQISQPIATIRQRSGI